MSARVLHTRVRSGIRLDAEGRFWHDGELVQHPAIAQAWHQGLERSPDGRYLIRFGRDWAYLLVEDAPFVVRRALPTTNHVSLLLSNGREEPLVPESLGLSGEGILYCRVMGDHRARFSRQAQADLGDQLRQRGDGSFELTLGEASWPVGDRVGHPPPAPEEGPAPADDAPPSMP